MRQAFQEGRRGALIKRARKALRRSPEGSAIVHMRVWSTAELTIAYGIGFELETNLSLGRGAGPQSYLMSISREDLDKVLSDVVA